jgi:tetratricopeptide (TPR) repeat protein
MGDDYNILGDHMNAISAYNYAMHIEPTYREPYLNAAQVYNNLGMHEIAVGLVKECKRRTFRHYTWLERGESWAEQIDDILSVAYYWLEEYDLAHLHVLRALSLNPHGERIQKNLTFIEDKL